MWKVGYWEGCDLGRNSIGSAWIRSLVGVNARCDRARAPTMSRKLYFVSSVSLASRILSLTNAVIRAISSVDIFRKWVIVPVIFGVGFRVS